MQSRIGIYVALVALIFLAASPADAHTGTGAAFSFSSGFAHPLGGLDHLLAMFAVGLLAAQLGGRALWLVPSAFVVVMVLGALLGLAGVEIPGVEFGIVVSILAIALPVAFALGMPAALAMAYVAVFAIFHGHAHGAELPLGADAGPYIAGFALGTASIHAAGVALGLVLGRVAVRHGWGLRMAGGAVALAGVALLVG